jgi:hypothetical protein
LKLAEQLDGKQFTEAVDLPLIINAPSRQFCNDLAGILAENRGQAHTVTGWPAVTTRDHKLAALIGLIIIQRQQNCPLSGIGAAGQAKRLAWRTQKQLVWPDW